MNVFIIGASGYVGRGVTGQVLKAAYSVTALLRSEAAAAWLAPGDVRIDDGSVEDLEAVEKGLETADAPIYLVIQGIRGAADANRAALGTIADHCRSAHRPLIVTSRLGVYAGEQEAYLDEATPLENVALSQVWRVALEQELLATCAPVVVLRPAMVYGQESAGPILFAALRDTREPGEAQRCGAARAIRSGTGTRRGHALVKRHTNGVPPRHRTSFPRGVLARSYDKCPRLTERCALIRKDIMDGQVTTNAEPQRAYLVSGRVHLISPDRRKIAHPPQFLMCGRGRGGNKPISDATYPTFDFDGTLAN